LSVVQLVLDGSDMAKGFGFAKTRNSSRRLTVTWVDAAFFVSACDRNLVSTIGMFQIVQRNRR